MKVLHTIPALPVRNIPKSVSFYREKLGFAPVHEDQGFAIVERDGVQIHLWEASDHDWPTRNSQIPVVTGAESFIAGTASCRVAVEGVEEIHTEMNPLGIMHPNAPLSDQEWGTREFAILDLDGNLITFFERV